VSSLALYVLGPPRVELDGAPVAIDRRKALALLVYLAVTRQDHSRDSLATLFWPEYDQSKARAGLRSALWSLTKALGEGWLEVDRETVRLEPEADAWLDVDAFQDSLEECQAHGHPSDEPCPACLSPLSQAVTLYQDDFLAGFTLHDSPGFDEWQFFQTEGLRQGLASALERLARGHRERGEYEGAITQARRWVALDPLHEPAQRLLMRLYAWSGQRSAALRQYEECARVLQEELGIPLDEETTRLYVAIKEKAELPPPTERPTAPAAVGAARLKHNLPVQLTPFVGREEELAIIAQRLADPACRLLTLVGPGGSGKTRLALEAAAGQLDNYPHGVFFVSLAPLDAADLIVPAVAQILGFAFYGGVKPRQQLLDYLSQRHVLLILDNFEHLLGPPSLSPASSPPVGQFVPRSAAETGWKEGGSDLVADMLKAAPALKILATSRAVLNVQGEHVFSVPGMDLPDQETAEDALGYSAVQLFLQGARRAHPGFEPTAEALQDVVRVCRQVEGMPLGILLAAAWVGMLTHAEIAAEIHRSLDFLETDLRDVPARQRSMRAVFDHSWNLLSARQRAMMRVLSVFRGGFTLQAAGQVTGASLRELRALVDRSLLQRDPGGRYTIHELLRQYAAEKLEKLPAEKEAARDRHCAYYARFLQGRGAHLLGRNQITAAAEIEAELENVRSGWRWAVAQAKIDEIDRSLEALAEFYWMRGWYSQGEEAFARATQTLEERQKGGLGPIRSAALRDADAGDAQEETANRGFRIVLGKALLWQGWFRAMVGSIEKARESLQKSLAIFRELDARREIGWVLRWLGHSAASLEEKNRRYLEALAIFEKIGDRRGVLYSIWGLGNTARDQGEYEAGKQLFQKSLALSRELGNQSDIANSLYVLGRIAWYLGQYEEAKGLHQESLALFREVSDSWGIAVSLVWLARDFAGFRKFKDAEHLLQESLAICRDTGVLGATVVALSVLGEVANLLGKYAKAVQLGQESLTLSERLNHRHGVAESCRVLGNTTCALRDFQGARGYFQQALEICTADRLIAHGLYTLVGVAALLAGEDDGEGALELLGLILRHPASAQWTKDRAATLLAELENELPPDIVAAALERGRARDLDATLADLLVQLEPGRAS
jgi:predicted ATPase/DNA-binding SARP family transcriptional activator